MRRFWQYQVRYRTARWLIHLGLFVWPPGRGKAEVLDLMWKWRSHVETTIRINQ
jgi:hypothetical protein